MVTLIRALLVVAILAGGLISTSATAEPARPEEKCADEGKDWSPSEKKVWQDICRGLSSFLTSLPEKDQVIRPLFLQTILLHKPWREAIPRQGVRIFGAIFKEELDLSGAKIEHRLVLSECIFAKSVDCPCFGPKPSSLDEKRLQPFFLS